MCIVQHKKLNFKVCKLHNNNMTTNCFHKKFKIKALMTVLQLFSPTGTSKHKTYPLFISIILYFQ